jgi:hypothetical protein
MVQRSSARDGRHGTVLQGQIRKAGKTLDRNRRAGCGGSAMMAGGIAFAHIGTNPVVMSPL